MSSIQNLPAWALVVAPDVIGLRLTIPNIYFIGEPGPGNPWSLVDGGLYDRSAAILAAAEELYGPDNGPQSILLTHGHFDHVGSIRHLAEKWNLPVYAHSLEFPYLEGESLYPPADPSVGGGFMSWSSPLFPRDGSVAPVRLGELPPDGTVPGLPGWHWIHTPGHTPGHVSFFRPSDGALVAGDAFVTLKGESLTAYLSGKPKVHRPPAYYTINWEQARESVEKLAALNPASAGTGHGLPMHGEELRSELKRLADNFGAEVPAGGFYAQHPAQSDSEGFVRSAWPVDARPILLKQLGLVALGAAAVVVLQQRASRNS